MVVPSYPVICFINGILPKRPYPPCLRMADRALLAGYPRHMDPRNTELLLSLQQSSPLCVQINGCIMAWRLFSFIYCILHITLSHYRHYVDSSEGIGHIKWLSDIFCHVCVCNIKSSLSVTFHAYMGLCVFSLPISLLMIERIFVPQMG